jgi:hypothetical protein
MPKDMHSTLPAGADFERLAGPAGSALRIRCRLRRLRSQPRSRQPSSRGLGERRIATQSRSEVAVAESVAVVSRQPPLPRQTAAGTLLSPLTAPRSSCWRASSTCSGGSVECRKRAFPLMSREHFPSASTVGPDLGKRRVAQRFPVFC